MHFHCILLYALCYSTPISLATPISLCYSNAISLCYLSMLFHSYLSGHSYLSMLFHSYLSMLSSYAIPMLSLYAVELCYSNASEPGQLAGRGNTFPNDRLRIIHFHSSHSNANSMVLMSLEPRHLNT